MAAKLREKDGFYWLVIHHHGRRRWKKIGTDKREALKVLHQAEARLALGQVTMQRPREERTVGEALRQWRRDYGPTFSASFAVLAELLIRLHLEPAFGKLRLSELDERHLLQFIREKTTERKKPLSASTLANALARLNHVMALAVEAGEIPRNPCRNVGKLLGKVRRQQAPEVHRVDAWSREEVATLLEVSAASDPEFHPLLVFLLSTGCRRGEALAIRWADLDLSQNRAWISRSLVLGRFGVPKSGKARSVVISPALAEALRDLLTRRRRQAMERGWPELPELVFCSAIGGPLGAETVTFRWDRVRRKAQAQGVRPLRLHDCRHTYASLALAAGKSVRWVAAQLGHANPEMTLRVYAHAMREEEADLGFLDFTGGSGRHPRGTKQGAAIGTRGAARATPRRASRNSGRGAEQAAVSLSTGR